MQLRQRQLVEARAALQSHATASATSPQAHTHLPCTSTVAPAAASLVAVCRPMPSVLPVTRTTLPASEPSSLVLPAADGRTFNRAARLEWGVQEVRAAGQECCADAPQQQRQDGQQLREPHT